MMKLLAIISILVSFNAFSYDRLSDTGLYSDIQTYTVASENRHYSPQYPLWTDGAVKNRWISLPPGTKIDTSNMDRWVFPNGTKLWKEFAFAQADGSVFKVETRLIEKNPQGQWQYYSFHWNQDQTDADLVPDSGLGDVYQINPTTTYDIPSKRQCIGCHGFDNRPVQSFQALQLSPIRDPQAPHQDILKKDMITLADMVQEKMMTHNPSVWPEMPDDAANPLQKTVFGYMVGNCSSCHRPGGLSERTGFLMNFKSQQTDVKKQPVFMTGINQHTTFYQIPNQDPMNSFRFKPNRPDLSAALIRLGDRTHRPMPPFGYKMADMEAVKLMEAYINNYQE
ncbi:MAG: hypothetical protein COW00_04605 [Bdellovibrio sp. CG12_big_fil_rev_8_21_14_0_65_39_13]|nr:MAG: hypothetical protein COW78_12805 [Bdellovibrio sp. CG22_combo_CG10-13_8_21_14_all_39_27]PIQ61090.1 MAG: hypothetical protein COW00_04605 [Bdellovibrio sp. CG12_big_fil_rev_8_21_14_0_65_39_13]PIR36858.1 MAG: hypothetical protein COV37_01625 [Bdellovibrio sp. CG11_big_fil_rev_8_21_14_0_20_39_38]PJB53985.1 MAG: hypothetical protein CO099_04060 [Bdellovibrio sp. CG_4_9_14_3_um_filter_39_7]